MPDAQPSDDDQSFYTKVAQELAGLIPVGSPQREWFRSQLERAVELEKKYRQAQEDHSRRLARHFRELKKRPAWRDRKAGPPKGHRKWVWDTWVLPLDHLHKEDVTLTDDGSYKGDEIDGWGPPELQHRPPELMGRLYIFDDIARAPDKVLPVQCFLLAVVHDLVRRGKGFHLLLEGIALPPAFQVYLDHGDPGGGLHPMHGLEQETITTALAAVREALHTGGKNTANEVPWVDDAPEYLPLTEASKLTDGRLSVSVLSRLCKPDGTMRYMRKRGVGGKVHLADLRQYMQGRQSDPEWTAAYMNWLQGQKADKTRLFWKCRSCLYEYPDEAAATDRCPKCKSEATLIQKAPPKPRR
jgi:hypothetical protein